MSAGLKVYEVNFRQSFEEKRFVFAEDEYEAMEKIRESWSGDIDVFSAVIESETTEGYEEPF